MPDHALRFGDVIEWDSGDMTVRWLILCPAAYGYMALWLSDEPYDLLNDRNKPRRIGWPDREETGWEYRLVAHGE